MAKLFSPAQRLNRLGVLNGSCLLNVQRLLVIGKLAFQLIHFQFGGFRTSLIFILAVSGFRYHFILFFEADLQLFEIRFIAFDFFLLTERGLHQIQVIAGRLIIGFKVAFRTVMFAQLARHLDMLVLFRRQLFARGIQLATIFQRFIQMNATLVGVAHIVRRHIVRCLADQVLKQVAVRLSYAYCFQRHAVFPQCGFHILERFTHPAVFWQQIVAQ